MSFSTDVKSELVDIFPHEKHCRIAELSALLALGAKKDGDKALLIPADNEVVRRKCFTLLDKTFNIKSNLEEKCTKNGKAYVTLNFSDAALKNAYEKLCTDHPISVLDKDCCKRAYLRGAFLAAGFVFEPEKSFQLQISVPKEDYATLLCVLFRNFGIDARKSVRKNSILVYVKGAEEEADALNVLGAHKALMEVANARIMKDVRNGINRRNNCDTANILKTAGASAKQIEDILFIRDKVGLNALPDSLYEIANARLEYPEATLTELGKLLNPPVGKSGVNHRLRKLGEYAEGLR